MAAPKVGFVKDGYRFKGGNPADPSSWEKLPPEKGDVQGGYRYLGGKPSDPKSWANVDEEGGFWSTLFEGAQTLGLGDEAAAFAADPSEKNRRALIAAGESKKRSVGFGEGADWVAFKQLLGGSLGQLIAPAAAGIGASLVSTPVGGLTAFSGVTGTQYTAQNLLRQAQEQEAALAAGRTPEETSVTKALGAAAGQTGLDLLGGRVFRPIANAFPFMRPLLGEGGEKAAKEAADVLEDAVSKGTVSFTGDVARGVGKGVAFEVPQEIAQSGLERWQAGLSLTDASALSEYKQAAIGAALLGGGFGGVSGALDARGDTAPRPEPGAPEAAPVTPPTDIAAIADQVFTDPEQRAAFDELTAQFVNTYGVPEDVAAQLAMGELRPTAPAPEVAPEVTPETVPEPTVAPAAAPTVEPAPIIPPAETITPQAQMAEQLAEVGVTPPASVAPEVAPAAPVEPAVAPPEPIKLSPIEQSAVDLIAAVDAGGVPFNTPRVNAIARGLGLEVTKKAKPEETVERIRAAVGRFAPTPPIEPAATVEPEAAAAPTEPVFEAPSEAPAPLDVTLPEQAVPEPVAPEVVEEAPPVPITKVAPGDARGARPVQRGTQGTQRGRPVEGAAQLTEGMKAQQDLTAELQAARDAREITDQEAAETLDILRAPASEQELRAMPVARRNQWVEAIALQRQVDEMQQRVNEIPKLVLGKPNPARTDMESALGKLQQRLDGAQQAIVGEARAAFETKRTERKTSIAGMRERLRDKDLTPKERRELAIELKEKIATRRQQGKFTGDPDPAEAAFVQSGIEGKSFENALQWVIENAPNEAYQAIAQKVQGAIRTLEQVGWNFDLTVVHEGDVAPVGLRGATGLTRTNYGKRTVQIWLKGTDLTGNVGTSFETFLHEAVHGATMGLIKAGAYKRFEGTKLAQARSELLDVFNFVVRDFNKRVRAGASLNDIEQAIYARRVNTLADLDEILAWTLSNPEVMEYLNGMKYTPKRSVFSRIVEIVRKVLGLDPAYDTALTEILQVGESLLDTSVEDMQAVSDFLLELATPAASKAQKKDAAQEKINKGLFKAQMANEAAGFNAGLDEVTDGVKLEAKEKRKAFMDAAKSGKITPAKLALQPTSWIRDAVNKERPGLGSILNAIAKLEQNMRGMRGSMERAMRRRVREVEDFVNKHGQAELSAMMTIARVNQVDVTAYASRAEALAKDPVLQHHLKNKNAKGAKKRTDDINTAWGAWDKLGKQSGGHKVYRQLRQFYKDMYAALRAAQDEDIRNLGLDKAATDRLIREARGDIDEDAVVEDGEHKGVPEKLFPKEYFPFRRFGEYALLVKADKRSERERYHFESAKERNEFQMKRAKQLGVPYESEVFTQLDGLENMRDNMQEEGFLLSKLFSAIDDAKAPEGSTAEDAAKFRKSMKDRLYQTYLMTLPERSLRKQFIHAELVTGQSADALRVFRTSAAQYAAQLPKVVYGGRIQNQIEAAYDSIKGGSATERARLTAMVNTIVSRTRDSIDPPERTTLFGLNIEQRINEFTFLSLMTSIASAAVQPLTLPFQVMPRMVSRYGPMQALKMVSSYTPILQTVQTVRETDPATGERWLVAPTIGNTEYVKNNPLRARLWKELDQKRDLFSQKQVDMLLRNRATPGTSAATPGARALENYERLVTVSGSLFSSMDQITREISGMSFAELEYNRLKAEGKSHEAAIEGAVEAAVRNTNETIGDYTEVEKLGVFRGSMLARMMGFLRTYSVQRTAYYFRMLNALTKGDPTQSRLQAFNELSMVLAFTSLGAGIGANFGYELITDIIDLMLPLFMDDDEMEEWRKRDPLGADSADYRFRFQWLPEQFGPDSMAARIAQRGALSELTGYDWTTRLSQSSLWLRDFQKGDNLRETTLNFLAANLAPQISQGANMIDGINEFMDGNWSKGFAKIMPAAVRGALTAQRFAEEGETTKSGLPVREAEKFTTNELVGQVLGFAPNELSKVREVNRKTQAWMRAMDDERGKLFKEYRDLLDDPDTTQEDIKVMVEKVKRYNAKVPLGVNGRPLSRYLIEPRDVVQSLRGRETRELKSVEGVTYGKGERETLLRSTPQ